MSVKTGQSTLSGTSPLTIGSLSFSPVEIEIEIGQPTNSTITTATLRTTGRAVLNPDTSITQSWQSDYDDAGSLRKQSSGTGKIANHYKKSGSSVVDSFVASVTGFVNLGGGVYGVEITPTVGDSHSIRWTIRG